MLYWRNSEEPSRRCQISSFLVRLAESLEQFGFNNIAAIDQNGKIVAGHARVEPAKLLDLAQIPVVRLSHPNATEIRDFIACG